MIKEANNQTPNKGKMHLGCTQAYAPLFSLHLSLHLILNLDNGPVLVKRESELRRR